MHDDPAIYGPHFDPDLVGPGGRLTRFHKGGKPREPSSAERENTRLSNELLKVQLADAKKRAKESLFIPEPQAPVVHPEAVTVETLDAEQQAKRDAARKKGLAKTFVAGETGGYTGSTKLGGSKSLLATAA